MEEVLQSLVETSPGALLVTDLDFQILAGNHSGWQQLKTGGAPGRNVFECLGKDQAEKLRSALESASRSGELASIGRLLDRSAGPCVLPVSGPDGIPIALLLRLEEIEAPKRPEMELASLALSVSKRVWGAEEPRQAHELLRALIEATPLAVVAIGPDETITHWNSAAEKILGWSKSEVLGRPLPFEPAGKQGEKLRLIEGVRGGEPVTVEAARWKKGGMVEVSISAAPLRGADGACAGVVAVITDVTERKRLEEQLRQAQKMEAVGRLAGGVAHDFNNLLTVITGYNEMLLNSLATEARPRGYALEIQQAAEQASVLTKQLLAFSRRQVAHPGLLDINPVVTSMSNMLRRLIGEDIELVLLLDPPLHTVRADPGQIEQIILNLVLNARDAMPGGGSITIETGVVELGAEYTQTHLDVEPGCYVCISVTDTGLGMTPKIQAHIFEPFFTTKSVGKGTGLGLSTVYGIVKQNQGNIWVYSEPGKGSTFKIYLPAIDAPPQEAPAGRGAVLERGHETILLVEDEHGLRDLIQELLEEQGYKVLAAANSFEAMQICGTHSGSIHLLLTDVVLPKTNGQELARRLRAIGRRLRVVYMSGYPAEAIVRHGVLDPGVAFLEKPFTPEALAKKVRSELDEAHC